MYAAMSVAASLPQHPPGAQPHPDASAIAPYRSRTTLRTSSAAVAPAGPSAPAFAPFRATRSAGVSGRVRFRIFTSPPLSARGPAVPGEEPRNASHGIPADPALDGAAALLHPHQPRLPQLPEVVRDR